MICDLYTGGNGNAGAVVSVISALILKAAHSQANRISLKLFFLAYLFVVDDDIIVAVVA